MWAVPLKHESATLNRHRPRRGLVDSVHSMNGDALAEIDAHDRRAGKSPPRYSASETEALINAELDAQRPRLAVLLRMTSIAAKARADLLEPAYGHHRGTSECYRRKRRIVAMAARPTSPGTSWGRAGERYVLGSRLTITHPTRLDLLQTLVGAGVILAKQSMPAPGGAHGARRCAVRHAQLHRGRHGGGGAGQGLLSMNQMSMQFFGRTSYHDYEGVASTSTSASGWCATSATATP